MILLLFFQTLLQTPTLPMIWVPRLPTYPPFRFSTFWLCTYSLVTTVCTIVPCIRAVARMHFSTIQHTSVARISPALKIVSQKSNCISKIHLLFLISSLPVLSCPLLSSVLLSCLLFSCHLLCVLLSSHLLWIRGDERRG